LSDRLEKDEAMKSIHESYANTVTELNQELLALKEAYQQLSIQLDEKTAELLQERSRQSTGKFYVSSLARIQHIYFCRESIVGIT